MYSGLSGMILGPPLSVGGVFVEVHVFEHSWQILLGGEDFYGSVQLVCLHV